MKDPTSTTMFQLIQWKAAIRLELLGINVAERSVLDHARQALGVPDTTTGDEVRDLIDSIIGACRDDGIGPLEVITLVPESENAPT